MTYPHARTLEDFRASLGRTPIVRVGVRVDGRERDVYLKLESANPCGSLKARTAWSLADSIGVERLRRGDTILIASTSGNLGVALAAIARLVGVRFVAVVDPKTPRRTLGEIRSLGGDFEVVSTPDAYGGYLRSRLRRVKEKCEANPAYVWANQYSSPANPAAHRLTTGPEIDAQMSGRVDAVFVAVSTGGTLAGIAQCLRIHRPGARIIGVDAVGSIVFSGFGAPRRLIGIGSSRRSEFIRPSDCTDTVRVTDARAFAFCRALREATGIALGGSGGAVLAACCHYLATHPEIQRPVCVAADGGERYRDTIYNDAWVRREDLDPALLASPVSGRRFEFSGTREVRRCPLPPILAKE